MISTTELEKPLTQEEKDLGLARAVYFYKPAEEVLKWLKMGASTSRTDVVLSKKYGPTGETVLAAAVRDSNRVAVPLLLEYGADPHVKSVEGNSVIIDAIANGSLDITSALLGKYPKLAELTFDDERGYHHANLLHRSIFSLSTFSVILRGDWGDLATSNQLVAYYLEKPGAQRPTQALTVRYPGNIPVAEKLLDAYKDLVLMKTQEGFSPLDVVFNPRAYRHCFWDVNGYESIRCTTPENDPNPNVLTFEIDLANRKGLDRFVNREDETPDFRPPVTVIFDFTELQKVLLARAERLPEYQALKIAGQAYGGVQALQHKQAALENGLEVMNARVNSLYQEVQNDHPHFEQIWDFKKNPLKALFYELSYKHIAIMMGAYQHMSTGLSQRTKNTKLDIASMIMSFVAGHIPSPFGIPFAFIAAGTGYLGDKQEQQRYKRIIALLPGNFHPMAQELAFQNTLFIEQHLKKVSTKLEDLSQQKIEALAKRCFVIAIYTIYTIRDKDIDSSVYASQPKETQLIQKIMQTLENSPFLMELIVEQAQEMGKISEFTPAYNAKCLKQGHNEKALDHFPKKRQKQCVVM